MHLSLQLVDPTDPDLLDLIERAFLDGQINGETAFRAELLVLAQASRARLEPKNSRSNSGPTTN